MVIHILNRNVKKIEDKMSIDLPGYTIKVFPSAVDYLSYVKHSAAMLDMFIVTDGGVSGGDYDINENISCLKEVFNFDLFTPDIIVFMNAKDKQEQYDKYAYLQKMLSKMNVPSTIEQFDVLDFNSVYDIITRNTMTYSPTVSDKKVVVQVDRGSKAISTKIIPELSSTNTVAIELGVDSMTDIIKNNGKDNSEPIVGNIKEDKIKPIPEDFDIDLDFTKGKERHVKYIVVTGLGGSGVSTTALTMAETGAQEGKVLLIDANTSMGLSHIVEKVLPSKSYLEISLEKLILERDLAIDKYKNNYVNSPNLHIMVGTLPAIRSIGKGPVEYLILNFLSMVEEQYEYIVIDLPLDYLENFSVLLSRADLILASSAPYLHKLVPLIMSIKNSLILKTKAYGQGLVFGYMTGQPDLNELAMTTIKEFKLYCNNILGKELQCTRSYICEENNYIANEHFRGIIDKADSILNKAGSGDVDGLIIANRG